MIFCKIQGEDFCDAPPQDVQEKQMNGSGL